ncbi:MAG: transcriptional regulator [Rhizobiaceae bacterium MnEN-MB40S]|nr:MAG: transcriptional regulator [Rhizobiaceae bacterium MnEN-MB40S]
MAIHHRPEEPPELLHRVCPSSGRPIDLVHLARHTMGDKDMEAHMLGLFARQARLCVNQLCGSAIKIRKADRVRVCHTLKCSATSVGAFGVSKVAESLEHNPNDGGLREALTDAVIDVENFISGLSR